MFSCNNSSNEDMDSFVPIDFSRLNKSTDVNGVYKKGSVSDILLKSPPKLSPYPSETSISKQNNLLFQNEVLMKI